MTDDSVLTDYIVVGAGSAGSVIARRLLDRGYRVHLIEAGNPEVPGAQGRPVLLGRPAGRAVMTTPQRFAHDRSLTVQGSAWMHGMIYQRGHRDDYDGWASQGCTGWDFDSVLPYFLRSEDFRSGAGRWHAAGGPLPVEQVREPHPASVAFLEAAEQLGYPSTEDFNGERMAGAGINDFTTRDGLRAGAWHSFMLPVLGNKGLTLTTGARVHRVLMFGDCAVGVEYSINGTVKQAFADGEVVLAAGVIGSPQILMLSGIGPACRLDEFDIPVLIDLPGVGENLHDHPLLSIVYEAAQPMLDEHHNLLEGQLFTSSHRSADPGPDLQLLFLHDVHPAEGYPIPERATYAGPANGYTIAAGLVRPQSRGALRLATADPAVTPLCNPNILAEKRDVEALVDVLEKSRQLGGEKAFTRWRKSEIAPGPDVRRRNDLREFVRRAIGSFQHMVGTCRMGIDEQAVVTPDLAVRGVNALRVADCSIMPSITSGNTNAPAIMIGEKVADLITASQRGDRP